MAQPLPPTTTLRHHVHFTTAARAKAVAGLDEVTHAALDAAQAQRAQERASLTASSPASNGRSQRLRRRHPPSYLRGREGRAALSAAKQPATEWADGHADAAEPARFHVALVLIHACDHVEEFRPRHAGEPLRVAARADWAGVDAAPAFGAAALSDGLPRR